MRTAIIILAVLSLSSPALAQRGCYHHDSSRYYFDYWLMERHVSALEGIQRSLERRDFERRMQQSAELARIRAESEAVAFEAYDREYQKSKDEARAAIDKMNAKGLENETREERIARRYKWKQYRSKQRYRAWRWGVQ